MGIVCCLDSLEKCGDAAGVDKHQLWICRSGSIFAGSDWEQQRIQGLQSAPHSLFRTFCIACLDPVSGLASQIRSRGIELGGPTYKGTCKAAILLPELHQLSLTHKVHTNSPDPILTTESARCMCMMCLCIKPP